jgi:hypothetical protein
MRADEPKAGSSTPKGTPLNAELKAKETKFVLDLGGLTPEAYAKQLDEAAQGKAKPPKPPAVDFTLVLTNTSAKAIQVWKSGDPVTIEFALTGPGVKQVAPPIAMTMEFRIPAVATVEPGKTLEFPIKSLMGGMRGISKSTYWTKPGEYELTATIKTGVSPAPEGAKKDEDGFGIVSVASAPLKLTVAASK